MSLRLVNEVLDEIEGTTGHRVPGTPKSLDDLRAIIKAHRGDIVMATVTGNYWDPIGIKVVKRDLLQQLRPFEGDQPSPYSVWITESGSTLYLDRAD